MIELDPNRGACTKITLPGVSAVDCLDDGVLTAVAGKRVRGDYNLCGRDKS